MRQKRGEDIFINYLSPDPILSENLPEQVTILRHKLVFQEEKRQEVNECLMGAFNQGMEFMTALNNLN